MAAGYIGKISAVVTANTSDLTKKLADAGQNTKRFSENLNRSISSAANSAQNSLQKIFTPLQNIERRLQTSLKVPGIDLPLDKIRAAVSLTEQINKPLARVASGFTGLSLEVQGSFLPALQRAQDQALLLNRRIEQTGNASEKSFSIATRTIDETAQALQRLSQAESIVQRGLSGRELQFRDPGVFNALTRTASLTQKAGNLPESVLADGSVGGTVERLTSLSEQIKLQFARLENLRLAPQVDTTQVEAASQVLGSLVGEAEQVQNALEKIVTLDEKVKALGFKDGDPIGKPGKKVEYGPPSTITRFDGSGRSIPERLADIQAEEMKRLQQASGKLTILSEFDAEVTRTKANMQEIRQEALKLGEAFDSVSNQRFFDASIFRKQQGELSALRDIIGRVSADVRGPLEDAFTRYAATVSAALDKGERGLVDNRAEVKRLYNEVVKLAAETGQVGNVGSITATVARAGDVGRAGFDKFSLALNQAAFAVDDFLSSTGGLEFKLRAVQNNVTQLAFILGNTKGLFIGLAAVIGTQLVIGLLKANGLLEEERDVLDALNDAFREQEQRVAALAESYDRLGESIRDAGLDDAGRTQAGRQRQLDEIRKAEEEARVARAAAVDPEVNRLRIERSRLQREAEASNDGAFRAATEIEVRKIEQEIERRSREAGQRESTQATVAETLSKAAIDRINSEIDFAIRNSNGEGAVIGLEQERQRRLEEQRRINQTFNQPGFDSQAQLRELEAAIAETKDNISALGGFTGGLSDPLGVATAEYEDQLASLTAEYAALEARIRDAAPGEALIRFTEKLYENADALDRARADIDAAGIGRSRSSDRITAFNKRANTVLDQARQARLEGDTARLSELTVAVEEIQTLAIEIAAAADATKIFSDVLSRISGDLNDTVLGEARARADAARRRANEAGAVSIPGAFDVRDQFLSSEAYRQAEEAARNAEIRSREVRQENQRLLQQFNDDANAGRLGRDVQNLARERAAIQQQIQSGSLGVDEQRQAEQRFADIGAQLRDIFERSGAGQQAAANANEADILAAEARLLAESQIRGESLIQTDAEKAARDVIQALVDIKNATQLRIDSGFGIDPGADQEARARVLDEARRQAAPALFALQDAVANAVLQGPSRQALNAADISTQQGTAELNRLLRGDDPARDQNLLELQKQTSELVKLNATLGAAGVAD